MNKSHCSSGSGASGRRRPGDAGNVRTRPGSTAQRGRREGGARPAPTTLPPEANPLLASLAAPSAEAFLDPTDRGMIIVRRTGTGVSVGAGRYPLDLAQALVRHDLAEWSGARSGQATLRITKAGRANRRREAVPASDAFRHQHGDIEFLTVDTLAGPALVRADAEESPLDWLRRRKDRHGAPLIDAAAYEAGQRLRTDITLAGLLPGITARWNAAGGGPSAPAEATDRMIAARQRLRHAFQALGSDFSDLLIDLCGFLKGLELIERERGWPPRSGKVVVRLALSRLANHYGVQAVARGPAGGRGIRAWQAVVIDGGLA